MRPRKYPKIETYLALVINAWVEILALIGFIFLIDLWYFQKCYQRLELLRDGTAVFLFAALVGGFSFMFTLLPKIRSRKILALIVSAIWAGNFTLYYTIYETKVDKYIQSAFSENSLMDDAYCSSKQKASANGNSSSAAEAQKNLEAAWAGNTNKQKHIAKSTKAKKIKKKEPPTCIERQISNSNPIPDNNLNEIPKVEPFLNYRARLLRYLIHDWNRSFANFLDIDWIANYLAELGNFNLIQDFKSRTSVPKVLMLIDDDFGEAKQTIEYIQVLFHLKSPLFSKQDHNGVENTNSISSDQISFIRDDVSCENLNSNSQVANIYSQNERNCKVEVEFENFLRTMPRRYQRERLGLSEEDFAEQKGDLLRSSERKCLKQIQVVCFSSKIQNLEKRIFKLSVPTKIDSESYISKLSKAIYFRIPHEMFKYRENSIKTAQRASRFVDLLDLHKAAIELSENDGVPTEVGQTVDPLTTYWPASKDSEFWRVDDQLSPYNNRNLTGAKIIGGFRRNSILKNIINPVDEEERSNEN